MEQKQQIEKERNGKEKKKTIVNNEKAYYYDYVTDYDYYHIMFS